MPAPKPGRRLTRQESKAQTRAKLIEVGRSHFLEHGIAGTVLENVAEEAGYSRGAVYSNFKDKDDLFLAVSDGELELKISRYNDILDTPATSQQRIFSLRQAFISHVTDPVWIVLRTEFELNALKSAHLLKMFLQIHRRDLHNGIQLANKWLALGDVSLDIPVADFVLAAQSLIQGLAMKQRLLGSELSVQEAKSIAGHAFDRLTSSLARRGSPKGPGANSHVVPRSGS